MEGVDARLGIDSRDSAFRILLPSEEGGLSSMKPDSGRDAPLLLNTFGGGLRKNSSTNKYMLFYTQSYRIERTNLISKPPYLGGTFFLAIAVGSTGLLSDDCGDDSSAFLAAFSANFRPFTSMTVTKSPVCDAGRFLAWVGLALSTAVTI